MVGGKRAGEGGIVFIFSLVFMFFVFIFITLYVILSKYCSNYMLAYKKEKTQKQGTLG